MDLVLIAPLALAGILLLRRSPWGYSLASVAITKGLIVALAVSTMGAQMALRRAPDSIVITVPFVNLTALNLVAGILLLRNFDNLPSHRTKLLA